MPGIRNAALPRKGFSVTARVLVGGVLLVAAAILAVVGAHAQGMRGPGAGEMGGMGGPGPMMFGGPPEHIARIVDRMLDGLNATDAQRSQIKQIAMGAAADLRAQAMRGRALRDQGMQIFSAPVVDAGAAESLRQETLAQHDQASKRVLQAMLDVAKVLTPEQRAKIGDRMRQRQAIMQERMTREHRDRPAK